MKNDNWILRKNGTYRFRQSLRHRNRTESHAQGEPNYKDYKMSRCLFRCFAAIKYFSLIWRKGRFLIFLMTLTQKLISMSSSIFSKSFDWILWLQIVDLLSGAPSFDDEESDIIKHLMKWTLLSDIKLYKPFTSKERTCLLSDTCIIGCTGATVF